MTKRKTAKRKTSDIQISPKSDRSGVTIEGIGYESIEDSFDVEKPEVVDSNTLEPIPVPHEDSTVDFKMGTLIDEEKVFEAIADLPEPLFNPTQRQYGEEFLPDYVKVRARLRRLAGIP